MVGYSRQRGQARILVSEDGFAVKRPEQKRGGLPLIVQTGGYGALPAEAG